jgi:murein L,D-transpeptidase YcbB/YkuD
VHLIKSIFFIFLTVVLAVALEAMTVTTIQDINSIHHSLKKATINHKNFQKSASLSEIIYSEKSTKGLMDLIINKEKETFKHLSHKKFIKSIYKRNHYVPIWFDKQGVKHKKLHELFHVIKSDITLNEKGKIYKKYQDIKYKIAKNKTRNLKKELKFDLELSSLYRSYLGYHLYGAINWRGFQNTLYHLRRKKIAADWVPHKRKYNIENLMFSTPLSKIIADTTPSSFNYPILLKELQRLKKIQKQGGWKKIPNSSTLKFGKSGKIVKQLARRLQSEGDYRCKISSTYNTCMKKAVKRFQRRHGIYPSGKINKLTRSKLNLSVNWKIKKVLLNLDRIKYLPYQAENRYIMVNIPEFRLHYRENGRDKLNMRVVVGDKEHHTPVFSNKISFIVLNPYWLIPDSIVKNEMIPKIIKNPKYLEERGYEVRKNYVLSRPPIDTKDIDWAKVLRNKQTKRYKFMQPPGPKNALGKIKFKFPNQFAVYLHDTSAKKYFKKSIRAFSHGCIRVAEPKALLATFAPHERSVNYSRAKRILKGKKQTQLNLSQHVPIHIVYLTAWINSDGLLHYRNDIYKYDSKQHRASY